MINHEPGDIPYAELVEGYEYPVANFTLDEQDVADYLKATGDSRSVYVDPETVPPSAVAAWALAELSRGVISPPGTVHSSQELNFNKVIPVGEHLKMMARVVKKLDRADLHLLTTGFHIIDSIQDVVITGKITVACRALEAKWWRSRVNDQE